MPNISFELILFLFAHLYLIHFDKSEVRYSKAPVIIIYIPNAKVY